MTHAIRADPERSMSAVGLTHEEGFDPAAVASVVMTIEIRVARIGLHADKLHWLAAGTTCFAMGGRD
jgi:hypothetical protein